VTSGASVTDAQALGEISQQFAVTSVPDFVPFANTVAGGMNDPGLPLLRSHYQQYDGADNLIGASPVNSGASEAGGDMGSCILAPSSNNLQDVNTDFPNCVTRP
jgi:hypothetical protein